MNPIMFAKLAMLPMLALNVLAVCDLKKCENVKISLAINYISMIFIILFLVFN